MEASGRSARRAIGQGIRQLVTGPTLAKVDDFRAVLIERRPSEQYAALDGGAQRRN
jgi:hypothetical protein